MLPGFVAAIDPPHREPAHLSYSTEAARVKQTASSSNSIRYAFAQPAAVQKWPVLLDLGVREPASRLSPIPAMVGPPATSRRDCSTSQADPSIALAGAVLRLLSSRLLNWLLHSWCCGAKIECLARLSPLFVFSGCARQRGATIGLPNQRSSIVLVDPHVSWDYDGNRDPDSGTSR